MVDDFLFIYSLTKAGIFAIILVLLRGDNIMGYTLDKDGIKDIKYCDYVEITDVNDDEYIYIMFFIQMNMDFVFMQKMNHLLNFCILEILDWNLIMLLEKLELVKRILKLLLLMTTGYSRKIKVLPYMEHCFNIIMKWE